MVCIEMDAGIWRAVFYMGRWPTGWMSLLTNRKVKRDVLKPLLMKYAKALTLFYRFSIPSQRVRLLAYVFCLYFLAINKIHFKLGDIVVGVVALDDIIVVLVILP